MSPNLEFLKSEIQSLPVQECALLIQHLFSILDKGEDTDSEELWLEESERRYQLWREGRIPSKPASAVFREALAKFIRKKRYFCNRMEFCTESNRLKL